MISTAKTSEAKTNLKDDWLGIFRVIKNPETFLIFDVTQSSNSGNKGFQKMEKKLFLEHFAS